MGENDLIVFFGNAVIDGFGLPLHKLFPTRQNQLFDQISILSASLGGIGDIASVFNDFLIQLMRVKMRIVIDIHLRANMHADKRTIGF